MALNSQTQVRSLQIGRLIREGAFASQARAIVPTLSFLLGERVSNVNSTDDTLNSGVMGFETIRDLSRDARFRINIRRAAPSATIVTAANANSAAGSTLQYIHEAYEMDTTKFQHRPVVEADEIQLGEGGTYLASISTQESWVEALTEAMFTQLGGTSGIWNTATGTAIGRGRMASIPWIVSDGLTTAERSGVGPNDSGYEVYLGVDRSAGGNEWLRSGYAVVTSSSFNLDELQRQLIAHRNRGGKSKGALVVLPEAEYAKVVAEVNFVPTAADMDYANKLGLGEYFFYAGAVVTTDPGCPSAKGYILTPDTWTFGVGFVEGEDGVVRDRLDLLDAKEIVLSYRAAIACNAPRYNTCLAFV